MESIMHYCLDKTMNQFIKVQVKAGWRYEVNKHIKLHHPAGVGFVVIAKSPSDGRALNNVRSEVRKLERISQLKIN